MCKRKCVSMGHSGEDGLICDLGNGMRMSGDEEYLEKRANTSSIQDAVKVLLTALGEDINREGIIKTPLRVAKALSEGTRGHYISFLLLHLVYSDIIKNNFQELLYEIKIVVCYQN